MNVKRLLIATALAALLASCGGARDISGARGKSVNLYTHTNTSTAELSMALSIDDYIITSFVAGNVSTFPREVFDSARVEIPPQIHVLATLIMLVAIAILVLGTLLGNRRASVET